MSSAAEPMFSGEVVVGLMALTISVCAAIYTARQTRSVSQSTLATLIQTLNTQNFELHRIFLENPALRPYFYPCSGPRPEDPEKLEPEKRYQLEALIGYVLDYFHLITTISQRKGMSEQVDAGYVQLVQTSLATNPYLQEYMDRYKETWKSWHQILDAERMKGQAEIKARPVERLNNDRLDILDPSPRYPGGRPPGRRDRR